MKKLAVLGPEGTYSDLASKKLKEAYTIAYYPNILEVVEQVDENTFALLPFENTLDGFVMETLDAIIKRGLCIYSQVKLDVDFSFVSYASKMEEVKNVYVQFKAYGQCQDFILKHHLTPHITQSNMESLTLLKREKRKAFGAIVPSHTSLDEFTLSVENLTGAIHDETRFILVGKEMTNKYVGLLNCSVVLTPKEDKPGLLYSILSRFSNARVNLLAILSRPRRDLIGKYVFYLELEINDYELSILNKIQKELEEKDNCLFQLLGIYNAL